MNIEQIREYCINKKGVTEGFPFDEDTLVFKVMGKMFALMSLSKADSINLKCNPEKAISLREQYRSVLPGFHMSKKHWNTIMFNQSIPDNLLMQWIDDAYNLIVKSLTKKNKELLNGM
ncbi:MAG: MmcQ/YjbR family DNA-binding protein [Bacteroidetes bacterium]|nr:MAG: MmcQ/YjbR family DNA-binding protein [Bacteroidota bacterium]